MVDWVNYGWPGTFSNGGFALTLTGLLRRAFPEWNVSLEALLVAMIGVHELGGPICFQWVLRRGGELAEEVEVGATPGTTENAGPALFAGGSGMGGDGM